MTLENKNINLLATKHVLHIVHGYNEPFLSLCNQYSRALQSAGWHVTVVYLTGAENEAIYQSAIADEVIFFDTSGKNMRGLKLRLILRIRTLLKKHQTQLIVAQRYKPIYLAMLGSLGSNIPVLGVSHAFDLLDNFSRRFLLRFFRHRVMLAGVSKAVTEDLRRKEKNLRSFALPNCIDTDTLEPLLLSRIAARKKLGLNDNEFIFANVGRLHDDKDQTTIILAFARIAEIHAHIKLLLIGNGKRKERYCELIKQMNLQGRVILVGAIPQAVRLFTAFDAYISASDREPFGIVLTEAMLARIPVISTSCGGAPEVLGEHALYFSHGDSTRLAAHMEQLIAMTRVQRNEQGEKLYIRVKQQFDFLPFCARFLSLIESMMRPL